ncbi:PglZ domain-containing protein [bacterium]|nr:PglZ domain-containing protein [bacterium]
MIFAWQATDFLELKSIDAKEIIRDHDVLYIYHNVIDATGDSAKTEEKVFEAVEDALVELVTLVRKLTSANAGHIFVTADHGFIYQNRELQESDYLSVKPEGDEILFQDRRFILGRGLKAHPSFKKFNASVPVRFGSTVKISITIQPIRKYHTNTCKAG